MVKLKCGRTFLIRCAGQQDGIFWWAEASRFATIETMKTTRLILLASLALTPCAFAVDPPPDGGYPNKNTAEGGDALFSLTTGSNNTAVGFDALFSETTGNGNTAVGSAALSTNTAGFFNTAVGYQSLQSNLGGFSNTAIGYNTLQVNTSGIGNTAVGSDAMQFNTDGINNTAIGIGALNFNTVGQENTAAGNGALSRNTSGGDNTALGLLALNDNTTGSANTAVGAQALIQNKTGSYNIAVGNSAGAKIIFGNNNIDIGNEGVSGDSGAIRIGTAGSQTAAYVAGITGVPLAVATAVGISADGQLGVRASSARFKEAIKPMDKASEAILSLRPVTFRYKKQLDPKATPQFGLVAEEVAKVDRDLVVRDAAGKPFTVRYDEVNAMLLNEFLKEHRKVEAQGVEIAELRSALKEQAAQLKKVSERLESAALAPRLVENR